MIDAFLGWTPVFAAGVVGLAGLTGCDRLLGLDEIHPQPQPPPPPDPMVDFAFDPMNPPMARNDFTGWVGMIIQPAADVQVASLGRWRSPMNSQPHQVKVVDADNGVDVQNAIVTVVLANLPDNDFAFVPLTTSIQLTGGHSYYLLTDELAGGDSFLDYVQTTVTPTSDFQVLNPVYGDPTATPAIAYTVPTPAGGNCYGPVNLTYTT
jgi:hypothetical protein